MRRVLLAFWMMGLSACGSSSPATPSGPTAQLAVSQASAALLRGESFQLNATHTPTGGASQDVTPTAVWSSSAPQVATVAGGRVSIVGLGTATISVDHAGLRQTATVSGRRRTGIAGEITLVNADEQPTMVRLHLRWDGVGVWESNHSGPQRRLTVGWTRARFDVDVGPGTHTLEAYFDEQAVAPPHAYRTDATSKVIVYDRDTNEELTTLLLPVQTVTVPARGSIVWPVTIPAITS